MCPDEPLIAVRVSQYRRAFTVTVASDAVSAAIGAGKRYSLDRGDVDIRLGGTARRVCRATWRTGPTGALDGGIADDAIRVDDRIVAVGRGWTTADTGTWEAPFGPAVWTLER